MKGFSISKLIRPFTMLSVDKYYFDFVFVGCGQAKFFCGEVTNHSLRSRRGLIKKISLLCMSLWI